MADHLTSEKKIPLMFISWHKHWKGIYLHFFPKYVVRIFLWGIDWYSKGVR